MKNHIKISIIVTFLTLLIGIRAFPQNKDEGDKPIILDDKFYGDFQKIDPVRRDLFLQKIIDNIVQARGFVESVGPYKRYNRNYRIVVRNREKNYDILFYIFSDNEDYTTILNKDDKFEFRGQFIIYTPVSSRRNLYIFDIILEDGAVVVD